MPLGQAIEPAIYFSTRQFPFRELFLTVRGTDRAAAVAAVRNALRQVGAERADGADADVGRALRRRTAEPRLLMTILVFFGALAALLAALGVYGLFSWSVALRTRELAIRLTLGAKPASVGGLVVRQSAVLIVVGLVVGPRAGPTRRKRTRARAVWRVAERSDVDGGGQRRARRRRAHRLHSARVARDAGRSRGGLARRVARSRPTVKALE